MELRILVKFEDFLSLGVSTNQNKIFLMTNIGPNAIPIYICVQLTINKQKIQLISGEFFGICKLIS